MRWLHVLVLAAALAAVHAEAGEDGELLPDWETPDPAFESGPHRNAALRADPSCVTGEAILEWANASTVARWSDVLEHPVVGSLESPTCTIPRIPIAEMTPGRFQSEFQERHPVIVVGDTARTANFAALTQRGVLERCYGRHNITLSTANQHSYVKTEMSVADYIARWMRPQLLETSGADTKYHFGDNRHDEWAELLKHYPRPSQLFMQKLHEALSFGLAGCGTGVPFHIHGHVFAEMLHGRKRWFLQAPGDAPRFRSDESTLLWVTHVLPTLSARERERLMDCTVGPGEILYIPSRWHHSTLNLGEAVFISTFV